jgi:hypothetical protein
VLYHEDRHPPILGEPSRESTELSRLSPVQTRRGLIEEEDRRGHGDSTSDRHEATATERQLRDRSVEVVLEVELANCGVDDGR